MNAIATIAPPIDITPLRGFVTSLAELLSCTRDEQAILESGHALLQRLVSRDDWLPAAYAKPNPERYQQYLLHCDSRERFSVVSFVWGPGQSTPVHDHRVWGLVGVLRGSERVEQFERDDAGRLQARGKVEILPAGSVDSFSPKTGDIHRVSNAFADQVSISIHVYGANIGAVERATYTEDGTEKPFISGYANTALPNLWDRSRK